MVRDENSFVIPFEERREANYEGLAAIQVASCLSSRLPSCPIDLDTSGPVPVQLSEDA